MAPDAEIRTVPTRHGDARVHLLPPSDAGGAGLGAGMGAAVGAVVLGHGAGGGVTAPDLVAVARAATGLGHAIVLVEQPYRVEGRRAPPRAPTLDAAWRDVLAHLADGPLRGLPVVVGGRSSGARVACRTALARGAAGVLCLAFPLRPPARAGKEPGPSRLPELDGAGVPTLVVQGERDPFGMPPEGPDRRVVVVPGDHSLRGATATVEDAARTWLAGLPGLAPPGGPP